MIDPDTLGFLLCVAFYWWLIGWPAVMSLYDDVKARRLADRKRRGDLVA